MEDHHLPEEDLEAVVLAVASVEAVLGAVVPPEAGRRPKIELDNHFWQEILLDR